MMESVKCYTLWCGICYSLEIKTRTSTGQWHQGWLPGVADTCVEFDVELHLSMLSMFTEWLGKLGYTLDILWEKTDMNTAKYINS